MNLKYTAHKSNIYNIWYIKCESFFNKIGMKKYPRKCFQWYCFPAGHINWKKGANFHNIGSPLKFSSNQEQSTKTIIPHFADYTHMWTSIYKMCCYILKVLRPQQLLEYVFETESSQNYYNNITGFDTIFHSMI